MRYLRNADTDSFRNADDFANKLVDEIEIAYQGSFESARAVNAVRRITKEIYTWYRLRDVSPFGEVKPPRLAFGSEDTRALRFFDRLDNFYFSSFVDNRSEEIKNFLRKEYIAKGRDLFDPRSVTGEMLDDFRRAAGGKLDRVNDYGVRTIINSSVERVRSWANIKQLHQARYKYGQLVPTIDNRTSEICLYFGEPPTKYIRIGVAAAAIDRLTKMEPGEFALHLYKSDAGRAFAQDPIAYVHKFVGADGVIADGLVEEGRGFPPYHPRCRTRVEGVDAEDVEKDGEQ
jgi:hypothetical protein